MSSQHFGVFAAGVPSVCVKVNLDIHSAQSSSENAVSERAFLKLKEEADDLYKDSIKYQDKISELEDQNLGLKTQVRKVGLENQLSGEKLLFESQMAVLSERNKELEGRCEQYEAQLEELKLETNVSDPCFNAMVPAFSSIEFQKPIPMADNMITELASFDQNRFDNTTNLLTENSQLKDHMGKAIMLAAIWQERCLSAEKKNTGLQNRLRILANDVGLNAFHPEPISRFRREKSVTRECKNCRRNLSDEGNKASICLYHSHRPLQFNEWQRLFQFEGITFSPNDRHKRFWRCCNRLARSAPEGCRVGHHALEVLDQT